VPSRARAQNCLTQQNRQRIVHGYSWQLLSVDWPLQFKVQHLSFRAGTVLNTLKALQNTKTFTQACFRKRLISLNGDVSEFWQLWTTTKEAYHESDSWRSMFWDELPSESHLQGLVFDLRVTLGFAKNVQCHLKKFGFALFTLTVPPVTRMTLVILSRMKWPSPNQSKHYPLLKNYKTLADLDSAAWKNSSKK